MYRRPHHAPETVARFTVTHVELDGLRGMSTGHTYPTREAAEEARTAFLGPHGLPGVLTSEQIATVEVRPCPCYLNLQPISVIFD